MNPRRLLALAAPFFIGEGAMLPAAPTAFVHEDFTGDGIADLIFSGTNYSDGTTHWFARGIQSAHFADAVALPITESGSSLAIGDFNRDGKLDLLTGGYTGRTLLGNNDGTFTSSPSPAFGYYISSMAVADFNGDSILDVAALNGPNYNRMQIALGDGAGAFSLSGSYPVTPSGLVGSVIATDLNDDGSLDLAYAIDDNSTLSTNTIGLLMGAGNGTFTSASSLSVGSRARALLANDLNNDGHPDLLAATKNGVSIIKTLPDGAFGTKTEIAIGSCESISLGDLDEDGFVDLVVAGPSVYVLFGVGDGNFSSSPTLLSPFASKRIEIEDLDLDGHLDLLLFNANDRSYATVTGTGTRSFALTPSYPVVLTPNTYIRSVVSADVNNDGHLDLAMGSSGGALPLLLGDGHGNFLPGPMLPGDIAYGFLEAADVNADGKMDLIGTQWGFGVTPSSRIEVALGAGDGTFALAWTGNAAGGTKAVVADFNNDAKLDLLATSSSANNSVSLFLGNGDGTFGAALNNSLFTAAASITSGDFNNDGNLDFAVAGTSAPALIIRLGRGDGTFSNGQAPLLTGAFFAAVACADFNGDGHVDLVGGGRSRSAIFSGNGDGTFQAASVVNLGGEPRSIVVADFNQDGRPDLAAGHEGFAWAASTSITLFMSGEAGYTLRSVPAGLAPHATTAGDFNEDGKVDLAAITSSTDYSLFFNTGVDPALAPALIASRLDIDTNDMIFQFDRPIDRSTIHPDDLLITSLASGHTSVAASWSTSNGGKTIRFRLPSGLADGNYRVTLRAGALSSTFGVANNPVEAETFILAGDVNRDRSVNFDDLLILAQNYGQTDRTFSQGNIDYSADGLVGFDDLLLLAQRYGTSLANYTPFATSPNAKKTARRTQLLDL